MGGGGGSYLENIQIIDIYNNTFVANMMGQHGVGFSDTEIAPIRYDALKECLIKLAELAKNKGASIHILRIGCGLTGGKWDAVEGIIEGALWSLG